MKRLADALCPRFLRGRWERLQASPLGMRLARGAFWFLAGAVISRGLALVACILVARMLGKEGFGELGIIQSTVGMFGVFAGFGLGLTATKYIAEFRGKNPQKAGRILALSGCVSWATGGVASFALVLLAPWLAEDTLAAPHLGPLLKASAVLLLLSTVNGAQTGALSGFEAFRTIAWVNILAGVSAFPLMVVGTWHWGLKGAVWGLTGSAAVNWLLNHWALRREAAVAGVRLWSAHWWSESPALWHLAVPNLLSSLFVALGHWFSSLLLVGQPQGYAQMGLLAASTNWRTMILFLPGIVAQSTFPVFAGCQDRQSAKLVVRWALGSTLATAGLVSVVLACCTPLVVGAYGSAFSDLRPVFLLSLLVAVMGALSGTAQCLLCAKGRAWPVAGACAIYAVLCVLCTDQHLGRGAFGVVLAQGEAALFFFAVLGVLLRLGSGPAHDAATEASAPA